MIEHDVVERRFTYSATTYHIPFKVLEQTDFAIGTDVGVLLNPSPLDAALWRCPELATSRSSFNRKLGMRTFFSDTGSRRGLFQRRLPDY